MKLETAPPMGQILEDVNFPADRDTLVTHARRREAPEDLITRLQDLPEGKFRNIVEVNRFAGLSGQAGQGEADPWQVAVTGAFPEEPDIPAEETTGTPRMPTDKK